ncbi:iron(III) transport system permease [Klebsiella michiganensis]|nr:iron(III) transport system permease [Klebsiella michiganensis]
MSHTLALHPVKKRDAIFLWVLFGWLAFALLPSWSLDYGLLESTQDEILAAYGWSQFNISWLWYLLPSLLLIRPWQEASREQRSRHYLDAGWALLCMAFIVVSATVEGRGLGYATLVLFVALGAIMTLALTRLEWLGGDRFVIGSLVTIVALIGVFIVWPSIAIFIPMFTNDAGEFAPLAFMAVLSQAHIVQVILNSIALSIAVGIGCTFFGLVLAIYTTRIAQRSAIIGRIFSILPIVTPPFVVGLGVTLMMGRSGYVTELMVDWFGLTNTDWLYGFTGIWLAQVLAFTPMAFMILDGAIKTIHPSLEEASYTLRASRWQTFNGVFVPLLKPALANAFLIVIVQSLADFSNPLVLGGNFDVLATQIYFYITGSQLDYQAASTLGAFLLLFSLLVFCIQYMWIGKRSYVTVSGKSYRGDVQPLPVTLVWSVIAILAVWIAFNALLYGSIFYGSFTVNWGVDYTLTLDNFIKLFGQGMSDGAWPSLLDTLLYAGIAAPITAAFGLLIAWIVVRQQFKGKKTIEFTTMLCFAVPGTVAGVSYILAFNSAPVYLTGTAAIVIISMVMRNVPVGIRAGIAGLGQIDKSLDEASLSLRAGSLRTITHILLPLLRPAILSALIYSFVRAITTVSAIVFLVTPDTRVATAYILNRVEDGEYGVAIAYGSILIVVMLAIIFIFDWLIGGSAYLPVKSQKPGVMERTMSQKNFVELRNVTKRFGSNTVIDNINLTIPQGQMVTLLGPSGCGKTTILRLVAGLEKPSEGQIFIDGEDVTHRSIQQRDICMVFQSYALFPHMSLGDNVGYGLKMLGASRSDVKARVREALAMVDLEGFEDRYVDQISGGQQQRVALARALILKPKVLLFDEPLSNLDANLRRSMRDKIRELQKQFDITSLYVTHDQSEAFCGFRYRAGDE